ncbi:MAG TPA: 50S ribosomal protein L15 [bacterium]|jgi:large subunit ribosomal protein L15|nr:50S ribosomal protein L15 [Myxococcales bacterium]OQA58615.1 MAG: 50S ribosomal protein L15 [bacterium ADurb.Bin270]HPW45361.1 50S ribosomal protein L15 [bacterium]HQG13158.1 50S ribosomal protein L15 [bacterium]HQH80751.1 50S ribosomal protein L15 [bacterium]
MKLNKIGLPSGRASRKNKRRGRGDSSGYGGTSCRGHKGQKARSGGYHKVGFEGGQMPLQRRLPKRGFTNIFAKEYAVVNIAKLATIPSGVDIDANYLLSNGLIDKICDGVKVLGNGELKNAITVKVAAITESARQKIEAVGGKVEVIRV